RENILRSTFSETFNNCIKRKINNCMFVSIIQREIQEQTVANFYLAFEAQLTIIPVINKRVEKQIEKVFDIPKKECIRVNLWAQSLVDQFFQEVVKRIPDLRVEDPFKALFFDSTFDHYRGVVANIALCGGRVSRGDKIVSAQLGKSYEVNELGLLRPNVHPTETLFPPRAASISPSSKDRSKQSRIDYWLISQSLANSCKSVSIHATPLTDHSAVSLRLCLSASLNFSSFPSYWKLNNSLLHFEDVKKKITLLIEQYWRRALVLDSYCCQWELLKFEIRKCFRKFGSNLAKLKRAEENKVVSKIAILSSKPPDRRAIQKNMFYIIDHRVMMKYIFPLNEIVMDFYDQLKSVSSGYDAGYEAADLIKMDFLLSGRPVEELATIVHKDKAYSAGKAICERLKKSIPRQMFEIAVQAAIGKYQKNVLAKCVPLLILKNLLKKQAEGKKKLRRIRNTDVLKDAFINVLKRK
uniref:GUF1 homolog, GTPase n=1 Tax=Cyprinus carpio TaxID=7962 RepID=A0A8C1V8G1_CYPCA